MMDCRVDVWLCGMTGGVTAHDSILDGSALKPPFGQPSTVILGLPGETAMAHRTDEFCFVQCVERSRRLHREYAT